MLWEFDINATGMGSITEGVRARTLRTRLEKPKLIPQNLWGGETPRKLAVSGVLDFFVFEVQLVSRGNAQETRHFRLVSQGETQSNPTQFSGGGETARKPAV